MNHWAARFQSLRALRRSVGARVETAARCELCGARLAEKHEHLFERRTRQLCCACGACAVLFNDGEGGHYRRVPGEVTALDARLGDEAWQALNIPIDLAFFQRRGESQVVVLYPSPAGATESAVPEAVWQEIVMRTPALRELAEDVEALLVHRLRTPAECYRVPIDRCYRLVGLLRAHWRGFTGGTEVWQSIDTFFAELQRDCGKADACRS